MLFQIKIGIGRVISNYARWNACRWFSKSLKFATRGNWCGSFCSVQREKLRTNYLKKLNIE